VGAQLQIFLIKSKRGIIASYTVYGTLSPMGMAGYQAVLGRGPPSSETAGLA